MWRAIRYLSLCAVIWVSVALGLGCTANVRAKAWGGTATVDLPAGKRLVHVTWKENKLWYLTRDRQADERVTSWTFQEKSVWGLVQGAVVFNER